MPYEVHVCGWYGHENAGDESFKLVFDKYLSEYKPAYSNVAPLYFKDRKYIFGGGGSPVDRALNSKSLKRIDNKTPLYALGVDIPVNGEQWDKFRGLNFIETFCRSKMYAEIAQEQGANVKYCPDLAFGLDPIYHCHSDGTVSEERRWNRPRQLTDYLKSCNLREGRQHNLGVILTKEYMEDPNIRDQLIRALRRYRNSWNIFFIPMAHNFKGADKFYNRMAAMKIGYQDEWNMLDNLKSPREILNVIGEMDVLITQRFHGAIFATIAGTPFISVTNLGKNSLYCEQEGLEHLHINAQDKDLVGKITEKMLQEFIRKVSPARFMGKRIVICGGRRGYCFSIIMQVARISPQHSISKSIH